MNIKLSSIIRNRIKVMAEHSDQKPEQFLAAYIEATIPDFWDKFVVRKEAEQRAISARIAAMRPENKISISDIRRAVLDEYGDQGTCVMGMKLRYEGRFIDDQIVQGSVTNEVYFQRIKEAMIAQGANPSKFEIEYGWMD